MRWEVESAKKAYYARRRRKKHLKRSGNQPPKQKQGGFENMRLIKKPSAIHLEQGVTTEKRQGKHQRTKRKRAKLPPGEALGARDPADREFVAGCRERRCVPHVAQKQHQPPLCD